MQHYLKTDGGQWLFQDYSGEKDDISLSSIDVKISPSEIYEGIRFQQESIETNEIDR